MLTTQTSVSYKFKDFDKQAPQMFLWSVQVHEPRDSFITCTATHKRYGWKHSLINIMHFILLPEIEDIDALQLTKQNTNKNTSTPIH